MKKILIIIITLMCLFFIGCKEQKNEDKLICSDDQVVSEEDKIVLSEITSQDFTKFEHVSMFGAENFLLLFLTYDKKEINDILSILKLNEQEFLYKHIGFEGDNPFNYIYFCMHVDFEHTIPSMSNPKTNFYVSKEGRLFIIFLGNKVDDFIIYYTDENKVNYQELYGYYHAWIIINH